jgi:glyoxylase-like metal-dependent hydrolase (beta-lactamase superfamily II)
MAPLHTLDLRFLGLDRSIASYVVETDDGLALFDCGPATTIAALKDELRERGLALTDISHLLLSHIHLDHAGAAGALVREHPQLIVWVSEIGAPHLADPARLESSARRLYGAAFDALWGELTPVPTENIRIASGDVLGWESFPSPGHASHHVCYFRDGTLLAGDACGVRITPSDYVQPVSPPPDIDIEAWHRTTDEIERRQPEQLAVIHFGVFTDVRQHLERLHAELDLWAERVRGGMTDEQFVAAAAADAGTDAERYDAIASFLMSYAGLKRYWDKQAAG